LDDSIDYVVVLRTRAAQVAREHALVLQATGVPHVRVQEAGHHVLAVEPRHEDRARLELERYARENVGWPPERLTPSYRSDGRLAAVVYAAAICVGFILDRARGLGVDWLEHGRTRAEAVLAGEWWRTVTALTLHGDLVHLAGNLVFGAVFVALTSQMLGSGVGLAVVLAGGAAGNALNALLQPSWHSSIGASTAIFAAVGTIVLYQWRDRGRRRFPLPYRLAPPLAGLFFLGFLGMSEEGRTDIVAHCTGFACGSVAGLFLGSLPTDLLGRRAVQVASGAVAAALLLAAWLLALAS